MNDGPPHVLRRIAHDINSPLATFTVELDTIRTRLVELGRWAKSTPEVRETVSELMDACTNLEQASSHLARYTSKLSRSESRAISNDFEHSRARVEPPVAERASQPLVLVVEDDATLNRVVAKHLGQYYRVTTAFDGRQGLALALEFLPDIIVSDINMPAMSGDALILELRRHPELNGVPIIVLSGQADEALRVRMLREGAQDYVTKPFGVGELRARVQNLIDRKLAMDEQSRLYDLAQAAIRAREDVLGIVAHDLRSPLNTIVMQLELARRTADQFRIELPSIDHIQRAVKHMERLIRDLLDVARLDAGHELSIELTWLDALELVEAAVRAKHDHAREASLTLRLDQDTPLPPLPLPKVWADQVRILQIFDNLIGNAIKFTPAGGTIRVSAEARAPGPDCVGEVVFSVADTGPGISAERLEHIFERFWQEDRSDRRGAGLGLAIVKGLVTAHQGRVWVESTLGRGTAFHFTLPIPAVAPAQARHERCTLLLVEDDLGARLALRDLLSGEGYDVLAATGALAALELIARHAGTVDLLITDIRLGEITGLELVAKLRSHGNQVPVVFMSGLLDLPHGLPGPVLRKPVDMNELLRVVEGKLARREP